MIVDLLWPLVCSSENSKDSGDRPEKNSENEVVQARHRRQGAIISSYASACGSYLQLYLFCGISLSCLMHVFL